MPPARRRSIAGAGVVAVGLLAGACAAGDAASPGDTSPADVYGDVGQVPDRVPATDVMVTPATGSDGPVDTAPGDASGGSDVSPPTTPASSARPRRGEVGEAVDGSRVLVIGDSLMASTAARYGGSMCVALGRLGWTVEVDAETGRFADFATQVLDTRLAEGWDVGVVMLGNNYRDDPDQFAEQMSSVVERLAPSPVVLFTVTEFEPSRAQVNDIIRYVAATHDNVIVADWAAESTGPGDYLSDDGLHPNDAGRVRLAELLAETLGPSPATPPGTCLQSVFDDDSTATIPGVGG